VDFRILGPVEARAEGRPLALAGARQRALLAVLLLRAGEPVSRERVIADLWGERPPARKTPMWCLFARFLLGTRSYPPAPTRARAYIDGLRALIIDQLRAPPVVRDPVEAARRR
jgi:hypothetical protein